MNLARPASQQEIEEIGKFIETELTDVLNAIENVRAIGIGNKVTTDADVGHIAICFYVQKKIDVALLEEDQRVVPYYFIPAIQMAIVTDVQPMGGYKPKVNLSMRFGGIKSFFELREIDLVTRNPHPDRPQQKNPRNRFQAVLRPGYSIESSWTNLPGTLGMIAYVANEPHIVSCHHLLGPVNQTVRQPSHYDLDDQINEYQQYTVGTVKFAWDDIDISIAHVQSREVDPRIFGFEEETIPIKAAAPAIGDHVIKSGRQTQVTHGQVKGIKAIIKKKGDKVLKRQFIIGMHPDYPPPFYEITKNSDSGCPWMKVDGLEPGNTILGIHIGGDIHDADRNPSREFAYATEVIAIQEKINFSFKL